MRTAVQLRPRADDDRPWSELVYGVPCATVPGRLGPVALFPSGQVVAYLVRSRRRRRLFVLRTLDVADSLAAAVPGVRPGVRLLLALRSEGRIRLARRLFSYLTRSGRDPSALPDAFYVRVGAVLAGRLPAHKVLRHLLPATRELSIEPPANRAGRSGLRAARR
jgi:hypothetical protein